MYGACGNVVIFRAKQFGKINYEPNEWIYRPSHGQTEINPTHTAIRHVAQLQCQYRIPSYVVTE